MKLVAGRLTISNGGSVGGQGLTGVVATFSDASSLWSISDVAAGMVLAEQSFDTTTWTWEIVTAVVASGTLTMEVKAIGDHTGRTAGAIQAGDAAITARIGTLANIPSFSTQGIGEPFKAAIENLNAFLLSAGGTSGSTPLTAASASLAAGEYTFGHGAPITVIPAGAGSYEFSDPLNLTPGATVSFGTAAMTFNGPTGSSVIGPFEMTRGSGILWKLTSTDGTTWRTNVIGSGVDSAVNTIPEAVIAVLGDPHMGQSATINQNFGLALAEVEADPKVDVVLVMGDLSNAGTAQGKADFLAAIANTTKPVLLVRGNHDPKATFAADYGAGYEGSSVHDWIRVIRLDNPWEETGATQYPSPDVRDHKGRFIASQMTFLQSELVAAESNNQKAVIVMHVTRVERPHPLPGYGMAPADRLNFEAILGNHPDTVLAIVSGHNHRPLSIFTDLGIPEIIVPTTAGNVDQAGGTQPPYYATGNAQGGTLPAWARLTFQQTDTTSLVAQSMIVGSGEGVSYTVPIGDAPSSNVAPVADFSFTVDHAAQTATFTEASTDSDGTIASWAWTFGDGATSSSQNVGTHPYSQNGSFDVTLTVTDNDGATSPPVTKTVVVDNTSSLAASVVADDTLASALGIDSSGSAGSITSQTLTLTFSHTNQASRVITLAGAPTAAPGAITISDSRTGAAGITAADLSGTLENLTIRNYTIPAPGAAVTNESDMFGDVTIALVVDDGSTTANAQDTVTAYALTTLSFAHDGTGGGASTHDPTINYSTLGVASAHVPRYVWSNATEDSAIGTLNKPAIGSAGTCDLELFGYVVDIVRMDNDGITGSVDLSVTPFARTVEFNSNAGLTSIDVPGNVTRLWLQACGLTGNLDLDQCAPVLGELYAYINAIDTITGVSDMVNMITFRAFDNAMTQPQVDAVIDDMAGRTSPVAGTLFDFAGSNAATAYTGVSDNLSVIQGQFATVNVN